MKPTLRREIIEAIAPVSRGSKITYFAGYEVEKKAVPRGFGVRTTAAGIKAFVLNYRAAGAERRITIGRFPDWTVAAAIHEARALRQRIDRGDDPLSERVEVRQAPTVNDLVARYLSEHAPRKRERSRREDESLINQWIKPALGGKKVAAVRRAEIDALHRKITDYGTPTRANRVATLLSKMFSLAVDRWEMRPDNPVRGIERNQEQPRQRYLTGVELGRLSEALAAHSRLPAANAVRLLLLTGARLGEVLAARWDQFDIEAGVWTKPAATTKQKREHRIPLSAPARQLLAAMRQNVSHESPYLLPGEGRSGHLVEIKKSWDAIRQAAELPGVRLHDLRHTYASVLASAGQSLSVIGALLGHTQARTTQRYAHLLDDPLRAATERAAAVVIGTAPPAEIVPLRKGLRRSRANTA